MAADPDTDMMTATAPSAPLTLPPKPALKPGWQTTEYWLAKLTALVGGLMATGAIADGTAAARIAGAILAGLATLGYSYSRGKVKSAALGNLIVLFAVGALGVSQVGCGANARQTELRATLTGLNVAGDALVALDAAHQRHIVATATSGPAAIAELTTYKATRDRVLALFAAAYHAIATAAVLQPSAEQLAQAVAAAKAALDAWDELRRELGKDGAS